MATKFENVKGTYDQHAPDSGDNQLSSKKSNPVQKPDDSKWQGSAKYNKSTPGESGADTQSYD
jgi:hypothetical protein